VNQDVLNLYKKAQNGGLNAQEVFWLEGQAATHPCFGMAYMILARHHFRNQSTIKNKALLKAAAYSNNRTLLRHYLEDTLVQPKVRPIPVAEMRPILAKKDAAAEKAEVNSDSKENKVPETPVIVAPEAQTITPIVEQPVDAIESETINSSAPAVEVSAIHPETTNLVVSEVQNLETNVVPAEIRTEAADSQYVEPTVVAESEVVAPIEATNSAETEAKVEAIAAVSVESDAPSIPFVNTTPPQVNWFLQMRVKLRADKFKNLGNRLRADLIKFGVASQAAAEVETPEIPQLDAVVDKLTKVTDNKANTTHIPEDNSAKAETILDENINPVAENSVSEAPHSKVLAPENATHLATEAEKPIAETVAHSVVAVESKNSTEEKPKVPEKEYEIGSFSSFTFLSDGGTDDTEEEIEAELATLEAVEFQRSEVGGSGEIIFEENDRIVEITVSPEALQKYFKGRLPMDAPIAFGEFTIEFDAFEMRSNESVLAAVPESIEVLEKPSTMVRKVLTEELPRKKVDDIVEKFIENEPSITRGKAASSPTGDLAKESCNLDDEWVTETLGRIYEKQGNRNKAIKIYEKLRLRFPEKSGYFADLIVKLKQ
jgi:hypothetical protein